MVDSILENQQDALSTQMPYGSGHRNLQVDLITYNHETKHVANYEVKRGNGLHDAGKKRQIMRDLLCQQVLMKSYANFRGFDAISASVHIVFHYGQCSIKKPFSLVKGELDDHFQWPVTETIEAVNDLFSIELNEMFQQPM